MLHSFDPLTLASITLVDDDFRSNSNYLVLADRIMMSFPTKVKKSEFGSVLKVLKSLSS
jgi:hypothetical protein